MTETPGHATSRQRSSAEDRRRARSTVRALSWAVSAGAIAATSGLAGAFATGALSSNGAAEQTSTTSTTSTTTDGSSTSSSTDDDSSSAFTSTAPQSTNQQPVTRFGGS
jgi:hypothetical protein